MKSHTDMLKNTGAIPKTNITISKSTTVNKKSKLRPSRYSRTNKPSKQRAVRNFSELIIILSFTGLVIKILFF